MFTSTVFSQLLAVTAAVATQPKIRYPQESHYSNVTSNATSQSGWDYIVAGAGPAGIIVAERLAEQHKNVLLLDIGGPSTASTGGNAPTTWNSSGLTMYDVPSQDPSIFTISDEWLCDDTPGYAACLLGGGAEVNAMIFVHPPNHDFDDRWPEGWKWADVENAASNFYDRNPGTLHPSMDGKLYDTNEYTILSGFLDTLGYSSVDAIADPNSKYNVYSSPPSNIAGGERSGPLRTYYPLVQNMTNFKLQLYSKVLRVVRDGSTVTGVEVEDVNTGVRSIINVRDGGRVILSAGTMATPAILINSGIGPSDQINIVANGTSNITLPPQEQWIDLPVGPIKDHPIVTVYYNTSTDLGLTLYDYAEPLEADQISYVTNRTGVLAQGYQRLIFWSSFVGSDGITRYVQGTTGTQADNQIVVKFYLTHGLTSVGKLGITADGSTEFITEPYFVTDADNEGLVNFIDTFNANVRANYSHIMVPSTNQTAAELAVNYVTGDHFVGTAKLGPDDGRYNGTSVVDINTKVYGTDNLFVVDGSIHPDLPTGNSQCIVMVVAEKAAELISAL